jgi:cytochrome c5
MISKPLLLALVLLPTARPALPQATQPTRPATAHVNKKQSTASSASQSKADEGERIFKQQCSRCHNAPEGFSPRISGTIVRHMRVRASLSRHDEEVLLHFFNP